MREQERNYLGEKIVSIPSAAPISLKREEEKPLTYHRRGYWFKYLMQGE